MGGLTIVDDRSSIEWLVDDWSNTIRKERRDEMNCFNFPMAMQTQPGYNLREESTLEDSLIGEIVVLLLESLAAAKAAVRARLIEWVNS